MRHERGTITKRETWQTSRNVAPRAEQAKNMARTTTTVAGTNVDTVPHHVENVVVTTGSAASVVAATSVAGVLTGDAVSAVTIGSVTTASIMSATARRDAVAATFVRRTVQTANAHQKSIRA